MSPRGISASPLADPEQDSTPELRADDVALRGLLLFARARGVTCVKGDTDHDNIASQHVMIAAGMRPAGQDERVRYFEIAWTDTTANTDARS
ncbi:GNAT family protein [Nonomuraea sp. LPB2021202275-12-8]|uniref:GNAT family protein n=1 Tax=Nonomuraea sp. LPB2021202275-12-8 TaxID=3120159 RepID=UPI00300CDF25